MGTTRTYTASAGGMTLVLAYVNYRNGLAIGNDPARPAWKPGNFFGEKFGR